VVPAVAVATAAAMGVVSIPIAAAAMVGFLGWVMVVAMILRN
jgi:hypothetical protein